MRCSWRGLLGHSRPSHSPRQHRIAPVLSPFRAYSNHDRTTRIITRRTPKRALQLVAAGGAVGSSFLFFTDEVKYGYNAADRTGRVLTTLAICVNDYRVTLKQDPEDAEEYKKSLKACHKRCAERTLHAMEKNGSIFIKLGQHLSSMGYLLPEEWTTTFIPLQDKCPVSSFPSIKDMYLEDTGHRIEDDFESFAFEPIGAASLAQVHIATLKDTNQKVAVKVQHPALKDWAPLDLALTRFTFATLKRFFPDYDLEWLSSEMEYSLPEELDFALEGQNARNAKEYFQKTTSFPLIIPDVISASKRILVMDYVTGCRPDDLAYLDSHSISRDEVSATLARIFNTMIFSKGAPLHCDPHGGNIAIRHNPARRYPYNFDIILYDHGLYRMPDEKLRVDYAKLWLAVLDGDEKRMRKYSYEVAGITDEQFPLFASAITGRDYRVLTTKGVATTARDSQEKENIHDVFGEELLSQLIQLLGKVPRIILLILKTNDLTRNLDEGLQTRQGPVRTFLILAKYASRTVWEEQKEQILAQGSLLWPRNLARMVAAWSGFARVEFKLFMYERWLSLKRHLFGGWDWGQAGAWEVEEAPVDHYSLVGYLIPSTAVVRGVTIVAGIFMAALHAFEALD